eukprot:scaffold83244_cov50-Prasinocladus_malaysianus.AAC.2
MMTKVLLLRQDDDGGVVVVAVDDNEDVYQHMLNCPFLSGPYAIIAVLQPKFISLRSPYNGKHHAYDVCEDANHQGYITSYSRHTSTSTVVGAGAAMARMP